MRSKSVSSCDPRRFKHFILAKCALVLIAGAFALGVNQPADAASVTLEWAPVLNDSRVAGYEVHYGRARGQYEWALAADANGAATNRLAIADLPSGQTYFFAVRSCSAKCAQASTFSDEVSATVSAADMAPPSVPGSLSATALGATEIALNWAASTDDVRVTGYRLQRCQGAGCSNFATIAAVSGTKHTDSGLAAGTTYRYRVAAQDAAGNVSGYSGVATASTWQAAMGCSGATLWSSSATPSTASYADPQAVELGVKFRSDRDGYICGIRFYKGPHNTGTHLGNLWRADGTLLAQAIFTNETATGWQQVNFAKPVAIAADTVYVASYHAQNGGWAVDWDYFAKKGLTSGPLTALPSQGSGTGSDGNGVYRYGSGGFPTTSSGAPNYWVDVVFATDAPLGRPTALEYGEVTIRDEWQWVSFKNEYVNPVVISQSLSANDQDPSVVRIKDVTRDGFWIRVQEWDYLDGWHTDETAGYLVMERGRHQLSDGTRIEAGYLETDRTDAFDRVSFDEPFSQPPVVLTAVTSDWDAAAVTTRARAVDKAGFQVGLQEEEAADQVHAVERIDYIAWEVSSGELEDGLLYRVGRTGNQVTHTWYSIDPNAAFSRSPMFLGGMQTTNGRDTAALRWRNKGEWGVEVRVEEERSRDSETDHTGESVGYFMIELRD